MSQVGTKVDIRSQAIVVLNALKLLLPDVGGAICQINLVKSCSNPDRKNTRYLEMSVNLESQIKKDAGKYVSTIITDALETTDGVSEFKFETFSDGRLAALPIDGYAQIGAWFNRFPARDQVQALGGTDNHLSYLKFFHTQIVFKNGEELRIFSKSSNTKAVCRGVIASLLGDRYEFVDPKKSLVLNIRPSFFVWRNIIFLNSYKHFESILNFREITQSVADDVCKDLFDIIPVTDPAGLKAALFSGPRKLNKIASLQHKPHVSHLAMNRVKKLIEDKKLPIKIIKVDNVETLSVDPNNNEQVTAYLHILNDDYLLSLLTDMSYIGIAKDVFT